MSKKPFAKFINPNLSGAKKKEAIRQEKRKIKQERKARYEAEKERNAHKFRLVKPEDRKQLNTGADHTHVVPSRSYEQDKPMLKKRDATSGKSTVIRKTPVDESMPLNKFIAHSGVCGRREAAELVKQGLVIVNGEVISEPGYKVTTSDKITLNGKTLHLQKNLVYILINKPKDYLTTVKDPSGRKTVVDLVKNATSERVYPVGRLDRNTTGVLLMTNDGDLAQKLTHPSFEIKKIYEAKLDKAVSKKDVEAIVSGLQLEDGFVKADAASFVDPKDHSIVGIEIHSGKNRIVRRIFEHLGYEVKALDRVMFGNLTKKNVDRGKFRFLSEKEVRLLKYLNRSFVKSKKTPD